MAWRLVFLRDAIDAIEDAASALHSVFGAAVVCRRRKVASIKAAVLVVREPRSQACGHVCGLKIARVAAAWRVLGLGVEPLLRQPLDHPQRVSRSLVKMHHVVFVVTRAMAYWSAMLECRVSWRRGRAAANPGSSGT